MRNKIHILITSGRGPIECEFAAHAIQLKFQAHLLKNNLQFEIRSIKKGKKKSLLETILFVIYSESDSFMTSWNGTIKWICTSPFRQKHKRKNWFIKCSQIYFEDEVEMNLKDIIYQSYRASGPGGQHRNKVETAIRIIHKCTGISVTASDGKSQAQNKKKALQRLQTKLLLRSQEFLEKRKAMQWNSQIDLERGRPVKVFKGMRFIEQ